MQARLTVPHSEPRANSLALHHKTLTGWQL
jgi:hypothetical protein